jgi:hypothetical protein
MENNIIILAILFNCLGSLVFLIPSNFFYLAFNQLTLSVPDEDCSNQLTLSVSDEDYSNQLTLSVPDEDYSNHLTLSVPDEDYSRNALCEINLISTFFITF